MRIPIYQMTHDSNDQAGLGLVFASEQDENLRTSIVFTIPIFKELNSIYEYINYMRENEFFMPFLLKERYLEILPKVQFPEMIFTIEQINESVIFEINIDNIIDNILPISPTVPYSNWFRTNLYTGNVNLSAKADFGYILISPKDEYNLRKMDSIFHKHRGIFLGLTPLTEQFSERAATWFE